MSKEPTLEEIENEFQIEIPANLIDVEKPLIDIVISPEEEEAAAAAALALENEGKTAEEIEAAEEAAAAAALALENEGKTAEEIAAAEKAEEVAEAAAAAAAAAAGSSSSFKDLAHKYIEKGKWDKELSVEDAEGNAVLVSELETIDEDTFFQIEAAIQAQEDSENEGKFLSLEGVEDRRKNILTIIKEGGDLKSIFKDEETLNAYLNPFEGLDLDNEKVQEGVYLDALIKYNKLDRNSAQAVVEAAKKDLSLDTKVQAFVTQYTDNFDKFVESKKNELLAEKVAEKKKTLEFKKSLSAEYKKINLKDTLTRKLTSLATNKIDGEYEIDIAYAKKMEDPVEAAELVLFLTDKEEYLKAKLSKSNLKVHKKVRQAIKLVPREKITNKNTDINPGGKSEFEIQL